MHPHPAEALEVAGAVLWHLHVCKKNPSVYANSFCLSCESSGAGRRLLLLVADRRRAVAGGAPLLGGANHVAVAQSRCVSILRQMLLEHVDDAC